MRPSTLLLCSGLALGSLAALVQAQTLKGGVQESAVQMVPAPPAGQKPPLPAGADAWLAGDQDMAACTAKNLDDTRKLLAQSVRPMGGVCFTWSIEGHAACQCLVAYAFPGANPKSPRRTDSPSSAPDSTHAGTPNGEPGSKGLYRTDANPPLGPPRYPNNLQLAREIDDCLKHGNPLSGLPYRLADYYQTPRVTATGASTERVAYRDGTVYYDDRQLDALAGAGHQYGRAALLASAFAAHALALRHRTYPLLTRNLGQRVAERDNMIGFAVRCLYDRHLLPDSYNRDPNGPRGDFEQLITPTYARSEEARFNSGWGRGLDPSLVIQAPWQAQPISNERDIEAVPLGPTQGQYPRKPGGLVAPPAT